MQARILNPAIRAPCRARFAAICLATEQTDYWRAASPHLSYSRWSTTIVLVYPKSRQFASTLTAFCLQHITVGNVLWSLRWEKTCVRRPWPISGGHAYSHCIVLHHVASALPCGSWCCFANGKLTQDCAKWVTRQTSISSASLVNPQFFIGTLYSPCHKPLHRKGFTWSYRLKACSNRY